MRDRVSERLGGGFVEMAILRRSLPRPYWTSIQHRFAGAVGDQATEQANQQLGSQDDIDVDPEAWLDAYCAAYDRLAYAYPEPGELN